MIKTDGKLFLNNQSEIALALLSFYPLSLPPEIKKCLVWFFKNLQMKKLPTDPLHFRRLILALSNINRKIKNLDTDLTYIPAKVLYKIETHVDSLLTSGEISKYLKNEKVSDIAKTRFLIETITYLREIGVVKRNLFDLLSAN